MKHVTATLKKSLTRILAAMHTLPLLATLVVGIPRNGENPILDRVRTCGFFPLIRAFQAGAILCQFRGQWRSRLRVLPIRRRRFRRPSRSSWGAENETAPEEDPSLAASVPCSQSSGSSIALRRFYAAV
jgi:hypothetical protein